MSRREPFWEFFAGAGLIGFILGVVTLSLPAVIGSGLVVAAAIVHWSRD